MAKKNKHARVGYNVTDPLDAIHLGIGKRIRMESDPEDNSNGDKQVGRRSYNDSRYIQNVIDITYSALATLVSGNGLKKGQGYRITDFATKHRIHNTSVIFTADAEPIVVVAQTANAFERSAYSPSNPNDIIHYDFNNNLCEDGTTPRNGRIIYRWDTANNVSAYYDWREVRFRRWLVTAKQQESMTTLTSSTLDCLLTFTIGGANLSLTYFNANRRIHAQVGAITHAAGELTLTIRKGTGSITKPLLKHNGAAWTANELANTSGIITNCLVRDAFVFMNYRSFGLDVVGQQVSPVSTTWNIGDGLSYLVDSNSFVDRRTFSSTAENISLEDQSAVNTGNNILFIGSARNSRIDHGSYNMTFQAVCWGSKIGSESFNNMFSQDFVWTTLEREVQSSFFGRLHNSTLHDHVISSTIYGPLYCIWSKSQIGTTTIAASGNMTSFMTPFIENSGIFLGGSSATTGRATALFTGAIINSLVGWFDPTNLIFQRTLKTTSFFDRGTANLILEEQSYIGGTTPGDKAAKISDINGSALAGAGLGVDGEGRIILGDGNTLTFIDSALEKVFQYSSEVIDGSDTVTAGAEFSSFSGVDQLLSNAALNTQINSRAGLISSSLLTNALGIEDTFLFEYFDGLGTVGIRIENNLGVVTSVFRDSINQAGLAYDADYSANFTARSLVDKAYVDAAIVAGDPYAAYLTFTPSTPLYQMGFADDFYQFLSGAHSWVIDGAVRFSFDRTNGLVFDPSNSSDLLVVGNGTALMQSGGNGMFADTSMIAMTGGAGGANGLFTFNMGYNYLTIDGVQWGLRFNESWQFEIGDLKGLEVSMQTSEGQEVVALEPIDGVNTDAFLVSKPVHEGTASAGNKLLKRSEVEEKIGEEVAETNANQFNVSAGVATIQSILDRFTAFTVSFASSGEHGSETDPIYHFLSVDRTNGRDKNQRIVYHCASLTPNILVAAKPISPLSIYDNQAAMLAGQGSQVNGSHYYYTGSTSAWRYNGVANGLISDYTEVVEIVGWQEWGTRPTWLFVTGDSYLTGVNNLNRLTFTFHKYWDDGTPFPPKNIVICSIKNITNGNEDTTKPDFSLLVQLNFDENSSPIDTNSIVNTSIYSNDVDTTLQNPTAGTSYVLRGGKFVFRQTDVGGSGNFSVRSRLDFALMQRLHDSITENFTIIAFMSWDGGADNLARPILATSTDDGVNRRGFNFRLLSTRVISFQCGNAARTSFTATTTSTEVIANDNTMYFFMLRVRRVGSVTHVNIYRQCTPKSLGWASIASITNGGLINAALGNNAYRLNADSATASAGRPSERNRLLLFNRDVPEADGQALANAWGA